MGTNGHTSLCEDYVSFKTAKLLKEKGFDGDTDLWYDENGARACLAPTLQMAAKWLRDEKHYYIQVMLDGWACGGHSGYYVVIQKTDSDFEMMLQDALDEVFYSTYEEACEAAIKYCLENLI